MKYVYHFGSGNILKTALYTANMRLRFNSSGLSRLRWARISIPLPSVRVRRLINLPRVLWESLPVNCADT